MAMRDSAPIKREWAPGTPNDFEVASGLGAGARNPGIAGEPGIGPGGSGAMGAPASGFRPLDEDVPCPGGPLWSADENDRQDGAWASKNFEGRYWVQEPTETVKGTVMGMEPTSDLAGSNAYPEGESAGRTGSRANALGEPPAVNNR